jgi:methionine-rich copper-binding protein CopC
MRSRIRSLLLFAIAAGSALAFTRPFHLRLAKSDPADKSVLTAGPAELKLWFSEPVSPALTRVSLIRGVDTVPLAAPMRADADTAPVVVKIRRALAPGAHQLAWRTVGKDGHPVSGTLRFTFSPHSEDAPGR